MTRRTPESVVTAVEKSIADTENVDEWAVHAILPTGDSQHLDFYLVMWEIPHESAGENGVPDDATLLKERYFQMPKDTAPREVKQSGAQFKTNGIARRDTGALKGRLVRAYARISNGDGLDDADADPLWLAEDGD